MIQTNLSFSSTENNKQMITEKNEKNIISRLILQKILTSEVMKFLSSESVDKINKAFLSADPEKEMHFSFQVKKSASSSSYYTTITDLIINWKCDPNEIQDLDGDVWNIYSLVITPTIGSSYSNTLEQFFERAECIHLLGCLIKEINDMIPGPIKVKTLTAEKRVVRDKIRKFELDKEKIISLILSNRNALRKNIRIGGIRSIKRDLLIGIGSGDYVFDINDGSRRRPRIRGYSVYIPDNDNHYAYLKRTF